MSAGKLPTVGMEVFKSSGGFPIAVAFIPQHGASEIHDHVYHEVVFVEAGSVDHLTVDGSHPLVPGDILILQPQVWHGYAHPRHLGIINCFFAERALHPLQHLLPHCVEALFLVKRRSRQPRETPPLLLHAPVEKRGLFRDNLGVLASELERREPGWEAVASTRLLDLLIFLARLGGGANREKAMPASRADRAVMCAVHHLDENFNRGVSLEELSRLVHMSPEYLSRSFTRCMGMGMVRYIHHLRVEEACRQLRYSDDAVKEISVRMGYEDLGYFERVFRRQVGCTPRDYRAENPSGVRGVPGP